MLSPTFVLQKGANICKFLNSLVQKNANGSYLVFAFMRKIFKIHFCEHGVCADLC